MGKRENKIQPGDIIKCKVDTFKIIEDMGVTRNEKNRTARWYKVACVACNEEKTVIANSLNNGGVGCKNCRKNVRGYLPVSRTKSVEIHYPTLEEKIEIMSEINSIWDEMKQWFKAGKELEYFFEYRKIPLGEAQGAYGYVESLHDWKKWKEEYYANKNKPEETDQEDNQDDDYDNDIDWNQIINDL